MSLIVILMIIVAYLLGSISSAVLICRAYKLPDPRTNGSNNPGFTNVLRIGSKAKNKHAGRSAAALVLVCDILKGMIPVWGSYFLGVDAIWLGFIGLAACLGHMYPVFFRFKGGKGVATAIGGMAPIGFDLSGLLLATWIITAFTTRYSSVAAIITSLLAPFYTWLIKPQYTLPVAMLCCFIIFRHYPNILRLLDKKEPKIRP